MKTKFILINASKNMLQGSQDQNAELQKFI
jgi:hypothetical protein